MRKDLSSAAHLVAHAKRAAHDSIAVKGKTYRSPLGNHRLKYWYSGDHVVVLSDDSNRWTDQWLALGERVVMKACLYPNSTEDGIVRELIASAIRHYPDADGNGDGSTDGGWSSRLGEMVGWGATKKHADANLFAALDALLATTEKSNAR